MKNILILTFLLSVTISCSPSGPYNESADARADIQQALDQAKRKEQPLVIIFGANWCADCQALSKTLTNGPEASRIANEFQLVKVNIGNFDINLDVANDYGNPISGGIPGAALLSSDGNLVYVTKPGELATVRQKSAIGLYAFFKAHFKNDS